MARVAQIRGLGRPRGSSPGGTDARAQRVRGKSSTGGHRRPGPKGAGKTRENMRSCFLQESRAKTRFFRQFAPALFPAFFPHPWGVPKKHFSAHALVARSLLVVVRGPNPCCFVPEAHQGSSRGGSRAEHRDSSSPCRAELYSVLWRM